MNVLIVDDEKPARDELRFLLRPHPQVRVVAEAETLAEASAAVAAHAIDLVLLDINLLGEDGFDLVPALAPATKVIFVTGDDRHLLRADRAGAIAYLLKPVDPAVLAAALERAGSAAQIMAARKAVADEGPDR